MASVERSGIVEKIKSLMNIVEDINAQIDYSNHLLNKQIDYKLETKYKKPIELKILSTPKAEITISEFLVYAGEIMKFDYVDILFGKYNSISCDQFKELTKYSKEHLNGVYAKQSKILTIDETSVCKTFFIETKSQYLLILENWQI